MALIEKEIIKKVGLEIFKRVLGSGKAAATSVAGASTVVATNSYNPGLLLFPSDETYATILNASLYLIGAILVA